MGYTKVILHGKSVNIKIDEYTRAELMKLKGEYGIFTYDDVIRFLITDRIEYRTGAPTDEK
jgi:antitoxin component of RelBE/YafQ-DinJ toxin-antitoxin module